MPGSEQPEGLAARSSNLIIPTHPQRVNGLSKIIWRAFFVRQRLGFMKMEIIQNIYVKKIFEGNCFKDTTTIADSVESGLSALLKPLKAA